MVIALSVAQEIKMSKAFRSVSLEGSLGLLRTADVIRRHFDSVVEPYGLTLQQYNVLRILRGASPDGLPTLEVADRMVERAPGITRMLDRLMAKGFVVRERSTRDRRVVYCRITDVGTDLLATLDEPIDRADDSALSMLSEDRQRSLVEILDVVRAGHKNVASQNGAQGHRVTVGTS